MYAIPKILKEENLVAGACSMFHGMGTPIGEVEMYQDMMCEWC